MPVAQPIITHLSSSPVHARARVLKLYRDWLRAAPTVVVTYSLEVPTSVVRNRIRHEFVKARNEHDPRLIDRMIFRGRLEYEETVNQWKQKNHVMNYFDQEPEKPKSFLEKFYSPNN